MFLCIL